MSRFRRMIKPARVALLLGGGLLGACSDGSGNDTVFGSSVPVGGGTARTYVAYSAGEPSEVGVRLSDLAMSSLPTTGTAFLIPLPAEAAIAPYKHVTINWNPTGHPPVGVFNVPHFDAHFYTITPAERNAITPSDAQFATKAAVTPSAEYVATGYIRDAGAIPDMGTHWTDPTSPEWNGQAFTRTFIYGSWNGVFTFYEPMFSKALLDSKSAVTTMALKVPAKYAAPGVYPTSYKVGYDAQAKEWVIALSGLVRK